MNNQIKHTFFYFLFTVGFLTEKSYFINSIFTIIFIFVFIFFINFILLTNLFFSSLMKLILYNYITQIINEKSFLFSSNLDTYISKTDKIKKRCLQSDPSPQLRCGHLIQNVSKFFLCSHASLFPYFLTLLPRQPQ